MILIDLNVLLDVIQERQPHCAGSSSVLERVVRKQMEDTLVRLEKRLQETGFFLRGPLISPAMASPSA